MAWYALAIIIEVIGIVTILVGIAFKAKRRASRGLVLITVGAALVAFGSLLFSKVF